jgi:hypothetical protein
MHLSCVTVIPRISLKGYSLYRYSVAGSNGQDNDILTNPLTAHLWPDYASIITK